MAAKKPQNVVPLSRAVYVRNACIINASAEIPTCACAASASARSSGAALFGFFAFASPLHTLKLAKSVG